MNKFTQPLTEMTSREKTILSLIGEGNSNKQIAKMLNLAECTITTYTINIFRKLNVNNRTHAVAIAIKNKLI